MTTLSGSVVHSGLLENMDLQDKISQEKAKQDNSNIKAAEKDYLWSEETICEFAREVAMAYRNSDCWTDDFTAEKNILNKFVKMKVFDELQKDLILTDIGEHLVVNKDKLETIIDYLYNYKND